MSKKYNIDLFEGITTNGYLLDKNFLSKFDKLTLNITLSGKTDHNLKRRHINDFNTYDKIYENIKSCLQLIKNNIVLTLRYNVDHTNINQFKEFVEEIKKFNNQNIYINTAYTYNHKYLKYQNLLTFKEYTNWNSTEALDILVKNNFKIFNTPKSIVSKCMAFQKYSFKLRANGKISYCNGDFEHRSISIKDLAMGQEINKPNFELNQNLWLFFLFIFSSLLFKKVLH